MTRLEIFANRSVQKELEEALEAAIPSIRYTEIPVVHGKGKRNRKLGSPIWPEENFLFIAYLENEEAVLARRTVSKVKEDFPEEGIRAFELGEAW